MRWRLLSLMTHRQGAVLKPMRSIKVTFGCVLAVQLGCGLVADGKSAHDDRTDRCKAELKRAQRLVKAEERRAEPQDKEYGANRVRAAESDLTSAEKRIANANITDSCTEPTALLKERIATLKRTAESLPTKKEKFDERRRADSGYLVLSFSNAPDGPAKKTFACGEPIWTQVKAIAGSDSKPLGERIYLSMSVDGKERDSSGFGRVEIAVPKALQGAASGEIIWSLTPDTATVNKLALYENSAFKRLLRTLADLAPGKHNVRLSWLNRDDSGGEFEVECSDFSTSDYAKRLRDYDSAKAESITIHQTDHNPAISAEAKKLLIASECQEAGCLPLVARAYTAEPVTFRATFNVQGTGLLGRGYLVSMAVKNKDGSCALYSTRYEHAYVSDEVRYDEKYTLTVTHREPMSCANAK